MHRTASERMSAQGWQNRLYFCAGYNDNGKKIIYFPALNKMRTLMFLATKIKISFMKFSYMSASTEMCKISFPAGNFP